MKRIVLGTLLLAVSLLLLSGCALDKIMGDLVNQHPTAVIDASPQEGHVPLTVEFNAGYSHDDRTIATYRWDFGDPNDSAPATTVMATHIYAYPGTYLVKLTVTDDEGVLDFQMLAVVATNPPPVVDFSASNAFPRVGDIVRFDASASYDSNGEITSYGWNFGDGNTGDGIETAHSYSKVGEYIVTLTLTDNEGASGTARYAITVQTGGSACDGGSCSGGEDEPLAVISGLPSCAGVTVGDSIVFDGSASRAAEGKIVNYYWSFGDGESATGAIVSHAYRQSGFFVAQLTVTDDNGQKSTASGSIYVHESYSPM